MSGYFTTKCFSVCKFASNPCVSYKPGYAKKNFIQKLLGFNIVFPETLEERNSVSRLLNHAQYDGGGFR